MHPEDLRALEAVGAEAQIAGGQVLIERGQQGSGLYVILEGTVVVETADATRELGPGTVVGELALFSEDGRRTARVRTMTGVRVIAVDRVQVEQLCADDEAFADRLRHATVLLDEPA
jgi:CRP-like cAMP-binding protein